MALQELLSVIDSDRRLFIQMHRPPDPDCIASAVLLSELLKKAGLAPTIVYTGHISKASTLELISKLKLQLINIDTHSVETVHAEDQIITIDCQADGGNVAPLDGEYIACIDHHNEVEPRYYKHKDIRPEFGACTSIVYLYAQECKYNISPELAALMIYGIRVDTEDLNRKKYLHDIDIFAELYKVADIELIMRMGNNSVRPEDINTTIIAYDNLTIKGNRAYSFAGEDKPKETLAELSDRLITLSDIGIVTVFSRNFNGYHFSVRSHSPDLDAGKIVKLAMSALGGDGGGHKHMAGGTAPRVAFLDDSGAKGVTKRVMEAMEEAIDEIKKGI